MKVSNNQLSVIKTPPTKTKCSSFHGKKAVLNVRRILQFVAVLMAVPVPSGLS